MEINFEQNELPKSFDEFLDQMNPESRTEFRDFFDANGVRGNPQLEAFAMLLYFNSQTVYEFKKSFSDMEQRVQSNLMSEFQKLISSTNGIVKSNDGNLNSFRENLETLINMKLAEVRDTVNTTNQRTIELTDNISTFIDQGFSKIDAHTESKFREVDEFSKALTASMEEQTRQMLIEIVNKAAPGAIKSAIKPSLDHYMGQMLKVGKDMSTKVQGKIATDIDIWNKAKIIRDCIVFGGVGIVLIGIAKFMFH